MCLAPNHTNLKSVEQSFKFCEEVKIVNSEFYTQIITMKNKNKVKAVLDKKWLNKICHQQSTSRNTLQLFRTQEVHSDACKK